MDDPYNKLSEIVYRVLKVTIEDPDLDLMDSGILDSLTLVQLMMEIESAFEITIPPELVDIDDYRTLRSMNRMVFRCSPGAALESNDSSRFR
ncbi:MAG: phosphopantetheine-binding protein [Balneolaceae bacterium]